MLYSVSGGVYFGKFFVSDRGALRRLQRMWKALIIEAMDYYRETWADVEGTAGDLDVDPWAPGAGMPCFTVWTAKRVYFPRAYDGDYHVTSVPRHPNGEATYGVGG